MRTIFLSSFHSFISKNILNTDVLRSLRDDRDLRVVIFVPAQKADFFRKTYAGGNVVVEGVDVARIAASRPNIILGRLLFLMIDSHYLWYKRVERRDARPGALAWIKYWAYGALVKVLSGSKTLDRLARAAYRRWTPKDFFAPFFEKYAPSLVFATDVFDPFDAQFLGEARHRGVKTLGMVRSWDNCWSKGLMPVLPDRLLVNNEILKEEAVTLHGMPADRIAVVGLPQFDAFVTGERTPREAFFRSLGVDPAKRLVVFAPAGAILSDTDWQICEILERALKDGKIGRDVHVFVRNHPHHPADLSRFKGSPHFTLQNPGRAFDANGKNTELEPDEQRFLADLMFHADLVMYVATSLSLDATVYDKPQIMVSFDGYEKKVYTRSVERYHDEDHMRKLIATGGVLVARDEAALIAGIGAYLTDPGLDRDGRRRIASEQLYRIDGKSSERVVTQIKASLETMENTTCAVRVEDSGLSSRLNSLAVTKGVPMDAQTACPACGGALETCARLVARDAKAIRFGLCPACGYMGYIDRPTQQWIIDFYSKDWDQEFIRTPDQMRQDADGMMARKGKQGRYLAASLIDKLSVGKDRMICEMGTGYGLVLEFFKRKGWTKLIGVENSKHRAELVKQVFGFEVLHGGFEEASVQDGLRAVAPIGLIFSHHVFEHTYHPDDIMRKVAALQKEGDHLIFSLPNADGEHIQYALLYLLHLHSFTLESLEALFNRHGYEIVEDASPDRTNIIVAARKVAQPQARHRTGKDHRSEFVKRFRKGFRLDDGQGGRPYAIYWEQKAEEADTSKLEMRLPVPALTRAWWSARKALDYVKSRMLKRVTAGHRLLLSRPDDSPKDGTCEIRFGGDILFYIK